MKQVFAKSIAATGVHSLKDSFKASKGNAHHNGVEEYIVAQEGVKRCN